MDLNAAIATIRASGLADRLERILPHFAPGLRIRTKRDAAAGSAIVSRFAGLGVLGRSESWPEWDSSALHHRWLSYSTEAAKRPGVSTTFWDEQIARYEELARDNPKPIHFLGMIRLRDIAPHASLLGLPEVGTLLFFYDVERMQGSFWPEARGGWRVLFVQDDADLVVVERPPVHVQEFTPSVLTFEPQYSLPEDIRIDTGDPDLCVYQNPEFERVHRELLGGDEGGPAIHQLGGAPQEVQHGLMLQCQLASNGADCANPKDHAAPRARQLAPGAKDWRLVLQIDSDEDGPGWMWGDAGRLYFCLHKDDLLAQRFDRSWCVEQCS